MLSSVRSANHDRSPVTSLPADFPRRELILELARRLAAHPAVERVWLFGSRARRDNFERSDIDLTIEAPAINRAEWTKLHLDLEEEADTLLLIDLVLMDDLPESFRCRVHREGKLLYERGNPAGTPWRAWATRWTGSVRRWRTPTPTKLVMDGTIQRFEFTFELFWKTLRRFLQREGIDTASPKNTLRHAYRRGLLEREQLWLDMLEDRNRSSHVYNAEMAREILAGCHRTIRSCATASSS